MQILVVSYGCPTEKYPANGIFQFDQARALAEAGHKVIFVAVDKRSIRRWRKWGTEHFVKDGVEVYAINIPLGRVPHEILSFFGKWGLKKLYRQIVKTHSEPDVIHAHFLGEAETALVLKPLTSAKFVMTEHSSDLNGCYENLPLWVRSNAKKIYSSYEKIITVSEGLAHSLKEKFDVDATVVYNMIDPLFCQNREKGQHRQDEFSFVFVGNLIERKQPLQCIKAFAEAFGQKDYKMNGVRVTLHIVGAGPLESACKSMVQKLGIEKCVKFYGQLSRSQIRDVLLHSDCFVLPTLLETFGVVYIEAMACGLPVIATRCGGPESFVNESNGVLIPTNNEQALVDAFRCMYENAKNYDAEKISKDTIAKFSPQTVATQLTGLYGEVLK